MSCVGTWLAAHADLDRRDREVLLAAAAGLSRAQVLARPETPLSAATRQRLDLWAARRRRGEPVAYLTGEREFWGLTLEVTPDVLVPRPETELLVEQALALAAAAPGSATEVLELGTGSGAVAVALAHEAARRGLRLRVSATDVCPAALAVARRNGRRHGVALRWLQSDWLAEVPGTFPLIVANPPYVAEHDPHLPALAHEPRRALVAGPDGLDAVRTIAETAPARLAAGGWLALEHGWDQGEAVRGLLRTAGFEAITTVRDLAGIERVTRGRRPS